MTVEQLINELKKCKPQAVVKVEDWAEMYSNATDPGLIDCGERVIVTSSSDAEYHRNYRNQSKDT